MSRSSLLLLISLTYLASARLASCADSASTLSADTSGGQKTEDKDGIAVFSRSRVGTGLKEFKGTGVLDASPAVVEKVLEDISAYPEFMPYVTESRLISHSGDATVTYQRLNVPFVSNRDYTVRVEHGTVQGPKGSGVYRDVWETDNEAGPPEQHGAVRVKVNEGSWLLEPMGANGQSTQATYQIFTDSGGSLPSFLANKASELIIPKIFAAIQKQARDPKYR